MSKKFLNLVVGKKPFEIRNKADSKVEIILYGDIGFSWYGDGITAKMVSDEITAKITDSIKSIDVRINSRGGDVFDGITIYNRLKQLKQKKTIYVDGLAASIASIIMMAGDEIILGTGSQIMIHKPLTMAFGNSFDFENAINRLDDVEEQLVTIYARKTGKSRQELRDLMAKETWMDSAMAIAENFADKEAESEFKIAASALQDVPWFRRTPQLKNSAEKVFKSSALDLKKNIEDFLARK